MNSKIRCWQTTFSLFWSHARIFRLTNIQVNPSHQTLSLVVQSHNLACGIPPASMPGKTKIARRHLIHLTIVLLTSGPVH